VPEVAKMPEVGPSRAAKSPEKRGRVMFEVNTRLSCSVQLGLTKVRELRPSK